VARRGGIRRGGDRLNRIGLSSPAFCHEPIARTAARVAAGGFDAWEIVGEGEHDPWRHRRTFRDVLASYDFNIQLHAPLSDANLGSLVPEFWELSVRTVERSLRGAAAIGATVVTVHPGNHTPLSREHYAKLHAQAKKAVRRLDRLGQDLGLTLCLENMPTGWAFETESLQKLLDLTGGTEFRLCFDLGHAHVAKRLPEFERAARRFGDVHVHDNRGDYDAHLSLGEGSLPWRRSVDRLLKGGYKGVLVIESKSHDSGRASLERLRTHLARDE
jgi:sugar phosphate isomerase/epimerase